MRGDTRFIFVVWLLSLGAGCIGDGGFTLLVELKTDFAPVLEFASVRTTVAVVDRPGEVIAARERDVSLGRDLIVGYRVAEFDGLAPRTYMVTVALIDITGETVISRDTMVTLAGTTGATVQITRNCLDVRCPSSGGDPELSACLGGECVEPRCTPETPESCPPAQCVAVADCTGTVGPCAMRVCEDGTCFVRTEASMCGPGQYCDPSAGCRALPGDAGPTDAADDAVTADTGAVIDSGGPDAATPLLGFAHEAYIKASNTDVDDFFGRTLSLSADGSTLAVGAFRESSRASGVGGDQANNAAPASGAVYVFIWSGGTWVQQAYIKASNPGWNDYFGTSVSLSADGNTLAVGAPEERSAARGINGNQNDDTAQGFGAVYVFSRSGGTWRQEAYVKASNGDAMDEFGDAVALSGDGDTLAVGAYWEDGGASGVGGDETDNTATDAGAVYVFARAGGVWSQEAYVKASNTDSRDYFGATVVSLSEDGDTLAVGAYQESSAPSRGQSDNSLGTSGAVYVFTRSGGVWAQQAFIKVTSPDLGDRFGSSVSLSADGTLLAVAAADEDSAATGVGGSVGDNNASRSGAVYVFARSGATWTEQAFIKASNTGVDDRFGFAVSLSADGMGLAVSARYEDSASVGVGGDESDESAADSGAAYVFIRRGGTWVQDAYVKASNTGDRDFFGNSIALSGDGSRLAVGSWLESSDARGVGGDGSNDSASNSGAAYTFSRSATP